MTEYRFDDLDPFETREAKLKAWCELGVDPYPNQIPQCDAIKDAREKGNHLFGEEIAADSANPRNDGDVQDDNNETQVGVAVAGRVISMRGQGALCFMDVRDHTGKIQVLLKKDSFNEEVFSQLALFDTGDFIWVSGVLFITKRGELTIEAQDFKLISKSLHPMPDGWRGLQDIELKQRQRYGDLIANEATRDRFIKRSQIVAEARQFMNQHGFMEVETPVLEHIPGGADAEPFVTHHNSLDTDFYMRISLELHLKRLVVGGFEKVYEIGKVFRNEGISPQHLQEFTMFELYLAYADYNQLMDLMELMYKTIIEKTLGGLLVEKGENTLDFSQSWPRVSYVELLKQYAGVDILNLSDEELVETIKKYRVDTDVSLGRGRLLDQLYKKTVRPHLIQPQFVVDLPIEFSPLAKKKKDDPRLAERFLILIDGNEVGNGFSELNDPRDQKERFEEQERLRLDGDAEAMRMDLDYVRALEYGMPPTAGFGVGIDRLATVLLNLDNVRESVLFPTMRPEKELEKNLN